MRVYRTAVALFAAIFICLGIAMVVVTAIRGGGIGILIGVLFLALGAGRLYLLRK